MTVRQQIRFPYKLESAFFTKVHCQRAEVVPEPFHLGMDLELWRRTDGMPGKLQIALKFKTAPGKPVTITLELMATFVAVDEGVEADETFVNDFINERAAFMLWPYILQMVHNLSSQMGIPPLNTPTPYAYFFGDDNE